MKGLERTIKFTDLELQALYEIVKKHHENEEENYYDYYEDEIDLKVIKSIQKKIINSLPKEMKKEIDKNILREKYHTYNNIIDDKAYSNIKNALQDKKTVEMKYFNMENAEFIKRKVDIYYTSMRYTIGYCHLRKAIRKFRTSRIASAKIIDKIYTIPENFNKNDY
jgi:predicted DNA-binding transcriptional regulator YafY